MAISSKRDVGRVLKFMSSAVVLGMIMLPVAAGAAEAPSQPAPAVQAVSPAPEAVPAPVAEAPAAPAEKGDYETGKQLFMGGKSLVNGGPPCISCHSAGVGELGGGVLAPNLTKAYVDESKNPLLSTAWVNGGGSPTMGPIFSAKNITEEEIGNIRAFLKEQGKNDVAPSHTATIAGIGLIGFIAILVLFTIIWSGRYSKRTRNTAHDALWRNYGGKGGR